MISSGCSLLGNTQNALLMVVGQCWDTFFFDAYVFKAIVASLVCLQLAFAWTAGRSDPKKPSFRSGTTTPHVFGSGTTLGLFSYFYKKNFCGLDVCQLTWTYRMFYNSPLQRGVEDFLQSVFGTRNIKAQICPNHPKMSLNPLPGNRPILSQDGCSTCLSGWISSFWFKPFSFKSKTLCEFLWRHARHVDLVALCRGCGCFATRAWHPYSRDCHGCSHPEDHWRDGGGKLREGFPRSSLHCQEQGTSSTIKR